MSFHFSGGAFLASALLLRESKTPAGVVAQISQFAVRSVLFPLFHLLKVELIMLNASYDVSDYKRPWPFEPCTLVFPIRRNTMFYVRDLGILSNQITLLQSLF